MIVQALVEYYEALARKGKISQIGWGPEKVSFALNISPDGKLLGLIPLMREEQRGKKTMEVPQVLIVPERVVRAAGIAANFLCDNITYFLGFDDKGKPERSKECFECAKELHFKILAHVDSDAARAVKAFFENWKVKDAREYPAVKPYLKELTTANLVFMIGGRYAHDDDKIRAAWQTYKTSTASIYLKRCCITGQIMPNARLHGKIKGVDGAQTAGANLISCNVTAFESYDLPKAPVSEYAAFAHVTALNYLLADREHRCKIGDTTVVYWSEDGEDAPRDLFSFSMMPTPDTDSILGGVMNRLSMGLPIDEVDITKRFYVLGLAPNAARIAVRFFYVDSFGAMLTNLRHHYERLEIAKAPQAPKYLSVPMLLNETVNPNSRDKSASPLMSGAVLRAIISGGQYPEALYQAVLGRIRAEQDNPDKRIYKITRGRAAIVKACLSQKLNKTEKEVLTVSLNESSTNRAYVLGRLFAVLERAQEEANPGINTTIKDRYFTSACNTPGVVFPALLKLANYHMSKAQYGKERAKEIQNLLDKLEVDANPFPMRQPLNDQGLFILGYYQQTQARYTKKEDA